MVDRFTIRPRIHFQ